MLRVSITEATTNLYAKEGQVDNIYFPVIQCAERNKLEQGKGGKTYERTRIRIGGNNNQFVK